MDRSKRCFNSTIFIILSAFDEIEKTKIMQYKDHKHYLHIQLPDLRFRLRLCVIRYLFFQMVGSGSKKFYFFFVSNEIVNFDINEIKAHEEIIYTECAIQMWSMEMLNNFQWFLINFFYYQI